MKRKMKIVATHIISGMFLVPVVALAQFQVPGGTNLPQASLFDIIRNIMFWLLAILGFVAVVGFVISGILYLIAAGDETKQETAKKAMIYSITGVIVGLVGLVVIYAVDMFLNAGGSGFFGASSLAPSSQSSSWSGAGQTTPTNTTEWLGTGTNPKTGNRIFIDQEQRKFELIGGKLTPVNDAGATTNSGPDSSYQP